MSETREHRLKRLSMRSMRRGIKEMDIILMRYAEARLAHLDTEALAQIWADELETNTPVRLNTLDPGPVKSLMRARFYPGEDPASLPAADSVVPAYLYLLGEGVTGESCRVTGNA